MDREQAEDNRMTEDLRHPLSQRRGALEAHWSRFVSGMRPDGNLVRSEICRSWQRSAGHLTPRLAPAPVDADDDIERRWAGSNLRNAARKETEQLRRMAQEGDLVAAIADPQGRLLWTCAGNHMQPRAESVNFTPGGRWDERSMGTNAVGLALALRRPTTVFSSEHYLPSVHEWVCYAAPIIHPRSGEMVGVLDISTTWNRHTPLGESAVIELARAISRHLPQKAPRAELEIHALGQPRVVFRGRELRLPLRQIELLCLLAFNPQGLSLDGCHARLYGDQPVSLSTLKAELSHLRRALDGRIGSRPYKLLVPVWADFTDLWELLRANQMDKALALYRGPLLAASSAPELEEWRYCLDAVIHQALADCVDVQALLKACGPRIHGLVRERLLQLTGDGELDGDS